jgi:hypothetical protein
MTIRNKEEKKMFENAIDRCRRTVWLITPEGEQFDLKTPAGRSQGIAKMLNAKEYDEPELFTSCFEDEMIIFEFLNMRQQAA